MRIANTRIPIAYGHTLDSVLSNIVYKIGALFLAASLAWEALPLALPLMLLGTASALYHATDDERHMWAQLFDAIAIQWVMAALVALALAGAWSVSYWFAVALLPPVWTLWWLYAHKVDRNPFVIAQGAFVAVSLPYVATWLWTALTVGCIILAVALQAGSPTHSYRHSLWHVFAGAAILMAAWPFILAVQTLPEPTLLHGLF